jgi:hypothetical protein
VATSRITVWSEGGEAGKFATQAGKTNLNLRHLNATAYAQFSRQERGPRRGRVEGKIANVKLSAQTGNVESLSWRAALPSQELLH